MSGYSVVQARSGVRSLRTGIEVGGWHPAYRTFSAVEQSVDVPIEANELTLGFWYYTVSTGGPSDTDWDYILILEDQSGARYDLMRIHYPNTNQQAWVYVQLDEGSLAQFKGQRVTLHLETYNNGSGGTTAMYIDDVSFMACR
jgi:hypothetical protein